jgi:hypothetical protein
MDIIEEHTTSDGLLRSLLSELQTVLFALVLIDCRGTHIQTYSRAGIKWPRMTR